MDVFLNTITWDVFSFKCLVLICCWQSKGSRTSSTKQDDFVDFRNIRSLTSGRWLQKNGKHVGPNLTLKPNTKASSLQFSKTEIKKDIGGEKKRNKRRIYGLLVNGRDLRNYTKQVKSRACERFIHEAHSFMSVSFYTYLCIYVFYILAVTGFQKALNS